VPAESNLLIHSGLLTQQLSEQEQQTIWNDKRWTWLGWNSK
jgi:hypothetical protein